MDERKIEEIRNRYKAIAARLSDAERWWGSRHNFLLSKGYILRPRLRPGWVPSWTSTNRRLPECEDSWISPYPPDVMDATRISDGRGVYLKRVETGCLEQSIAMFFSSKELRSDPRNHCVPILEVLQDDKDESVSFLVTPLLRTMDDPPFEVVDNVVDFIDQILTGLAFMHAHGVAHRDCAHANILMDADTLFPKGFHAIKRNRLREDICTDSPACSRIGHPVRYYFIDFGISVYMPPGTEHRTLGADGRDRDVPELSWEVPYDPFKVDIFIIGNLLKQYIHAKYANVEFLVPLIEFMTRQQPEARPDAKTALRAWQDIRSTISTVSTFWRLRPRDEIAVGTVIFDSLSLMRTGADATRRLYNWVTSNAS